MLAYGADFRGVGPDMDMTAVGADPNLLPVSSKYLALFDVA